MVQLVRVHKMTKHFSINNKPQTKAERERVARNIAEAIDALYREGAAPRDRGSGFSMLA